LSLLHGAKAIARHLSTGTYPISERQVRHLIKRDLIPTFKLGGTICSTPDLLSQYFEDLAKGGTHD
jgi:hypothetical protein